MTSNLAKHLQISTPVLMSKDPIGAVAEMLYRSMKGAGTNDDSLIRILLAHSEVRSLSREQKQTHQWFTSRLR